MPLGWDTEMIKRYINDICYLDPDISCKELSRKIVSRSVKNDSGLSADDITCVAIHYRKPRRTMVITGPPFYEENDRKIALMADEFKGKKIICGGTTSNIIARELNLEMDHLLDSDVIHFVVGTKINPAHQDPNLPVELEIRRNLIRSLCKTLEKDYLKETKITFF